MLSTLWLEIDYNFDNEVSVDVLFKILLPTLMQEEY